MTRDEDLMREAVSLVKRIECRYSNRQDLVMMGFNSLGWLFIYLGDDPMFRFDERGRLRRAFVDGKLFRTSGHTLAVLERQSGSGSNESGVQAESTLLRKDLTADELTAFRMRVRREVDGLIDGLGGSVITRQSPAEMQDLVREIERGLRRVLDSPDFLAPAIVRRSPKNG